MGADVIDLVTRERLNDESPSFAKTIAKYPGRWPRHTVSAAVHLDGLADDFDEEDFVEVLDDMEKAVPPARRTEPATTYVPPSKLPSGAALERTHAALDRLLRRKRRET